MANPTEYWRIGSDWLTRAQLTSDSSTIIERFPAQDVTGSARLWLNPADDSDRIAPYAKRIKDMNGRAWRQGGVSGKIILVGLSPLMFAYLLNRFFSNGAEYAKLTIMVYNRGNGDWECYQCYANLPEYTEMEAEAGGYSKVEITWFKGTQVTDGAPAFTSGFSIGFKA